MEIFKKIIGVLLIAVIVYGFILLSILFFGSETEYPFNTTILDLLQL